MIDVELLNAIDGMKENAEHHLEQYKEFKTRYMEEDYDPYGTYVFWQGYNNALRNILHEKDLIEQHRG